MVASLLPGAVSLGYSPGNKLQGGIDGLLEVIVIGGYLELIFGTPGNGLRGLIIILVEGSFFGEVGVRLTLFCFRIGWSGGEREFGEIFGEILRVEDISGGGSCESSVGLTYCGCWVFRTWRGFR